MRATLAALLAVACIPSAVAQVYACDGLTFPDYDSCKFHPLPTPSRHLLFSI